jgi:hypothetical protein
MDRGEFGYQQLLHECCLVRPDEIADRIPPEWNHLDHCMEPVGARAARSTVPYTVVSTQPWKNDRSHLVPLWMRGLRRGGAGRRGRARHSSRAGSSRATSSRGMLRAWVAREGGRARGLAAREDAGPACAKGVEGLRPDEVGRALGRSDGKEIGRRSCLACTSAGKNGGTITI